MQEEKVSQSESGQPTITADTKDQHYGFRLADVKDDRARRAYDRWGKTRR